MLLIIEFLPPQTRSPEETIAKIMAWSLTKDSLSIFHNELLWFRDRVRVLFSPQLVNTYIFPKR